MRPEPTGNTRLEGYGVSPSQLGNAKRQGGAAPDERSGCGVSPHNSYTIFEFIVGMQKKEPVVVTKEWLQRQRDNFNEKVFYLQESGYREIGIDEYFRLLFDRHGFTYLQEFKNLPSVAIEPDGWYCGLVRFMKSCNESTGEQWQREHSRSFIVTREYQRTLELIGREKCYTSPLIYIGHKRPGKNARAFFAFVIDIDAVQKKGLEFYFRAIRDKRAPRPSMIVSSGSGIHLYFLLDEPISLNSYSSPMLHYMKVCLTTKLWGMCTDVTPPQYHGIFQGYRVPGTKPKTEYGLSDNVKCFIDIDDDIPYYTVTDLNSYLLTEKSLSSEQPLNKLQLSRLEEMVFDPLRVKTPLEEAKKLWPEWYKKRNKQVDIKASLITIAEQASNYSQNGKPWDIKRDLYDWWLRILRASIDNKITVGHRYHCILTLAVFAEKCNIDYEELKRDAYSLLEYMESLTTDPHNHFKKTDVKDALSAYRESSRLYKRWILEKLTAIPMPPNKRNYRKQKVHLKIARNTQAILHESDGVNWRENNGRKPQWIVVKEWRDKNPDNLNKSQCAQECNLTRKTVIKWWNCKTEEDAFRIGEAAKLALLAKKKDVGENSVGSMGNTGYIADKKLADIFTTMTADTSQDKVSLETQQDTKERLAEFIDFATDEIMKMAGVPEPLIPMFRDSFRSQMKDPKILQAFMAARDNKEITTDAESSALLQHLLTKIGNNK